MLLLLVGRNQSKDLMIEVGKKHESQFLFYCHLHEDSERQVCYILGQFGLYMLGL